MTHRLRAIAAAGVLTIAALAAAPAVLAGDPCFHGYTIPASTTADTSRVAMEECAFLPTNVRAAPGTTISFTNGSASVHLLTGANQEWGDREKEIPPGASVTMTFDKPGVYAFSCALHRGMSGAVIVGDPGAAVGATGAGSASAGDSGAGDTGMAGTIAVGGLAALAALGWAVAILQRRRTDQVKPEHAPAR